jgi:hypothetical protein
MGKGGEGSASEKGVIAERRIKKRTGFGILGVEGRGREIERKISKREHRSC